MSPRSVPLFPYPTLFQPLRRDANGFEFRYRRSSANGYAVTQAGAVWGKSWQKGDMTVAVNWRENGELFNDERSLTADSDFQRFGGRDYRSPASNPDRKSTSLNSVTNAHLVCRLLLE